MKCPPNVPLLCSAKYIPSESATSIGRIDGSPPIIEPEPSTTAMAFSVVSPHETSEFHVASRTARSFWLM